MMTGKSEIAVARSATPLQNRVDPFGAIHAFPSRGMFTGNRGIIHDPVKKTLLRRRWSNPAWIICVLHLPGREPRKPMGFNRPDGGVGWTELFFLDEVTALAAGHRPCFYCQRARAREFLGCYGDAVHTAAPRTPELDRRLHGERLASSRKPGTPISPEAIADLPDGTMIASGDRAFAVHGGRLLPWSFDGYGPATAVSALAEPMLLTPATTVGILRAGYTPVWHPSAPGDSSRAT